MGESPAGSTPSQKAPSTKAVPVAQEKREFPRFRVQGATASIGKAAGLLANLGLGLRKHEVINLSQGGAMIRPGKRLPVKSRHELRIEIPKYREVIEALGEIRWCLASAKSDTDIYVGVMFVDLPAAEVRKITRIYELFTSTEYKAMAAVRKDASSVRIKAPKL
jgi:hypothetical protein